MAVTLLMMCAIRRYRTTEDGIMSVDLNNIYITSKSALNTNNNKIRLNSLCSTQKINPEVQIGSPYIIIENILFLTGLYNVNKFPQFYSYFI